MLRFLHLGLQQTCVFGTVGLLQARPRQHSPSCFLLAPVCPWFTLALIFSPISSTGTPASRESMKESRAGKSSAGELLLGAVGRRATPAVLVAVLCGVLLRTVVLAPCLPAVPFAVFPGLEVFFTAFDLTFQLGGVFFLLAVLLILLPLPSSLDCSPYSINRLLLRKL